jgi:acetyl-CoA C-acetyltransferase
VIAGGQENMSASPHVLPGSRDGFRMGDGKLVDSMIVDGLWDVYNKYHMGTTAENVAAKYGISRADQDAFAAASQQKAEAAQKAGKFKDEIVGVEMPQQEGPARRVRHRRISEGRHHRRDARGPAPRIRQGGHRDGRQCVRPQRRRGSRDDDVRRKAKELGIKPLARIKAYSSAGVDPTIMGMGPVPASQLCLKKAGWTHQDSRPHGDQRSLRGAGHRGQSRDGLGHVEGST